MKIIIFGTIYYIVIDECETHIVLSTFFACIFEALMLNLFQNFGIFTKLLFCINYCQKKQKEQQKILKRLRQKQIMS